MGRRYHVAGGVLLVCGACNSAPPVPENPVPFGAPDLGTTRTLSVAPPPISGGTMLLSKDGTTAVVADPDRDFVSFVDLAGHTVRAQASLSPRDEPGRMAEDSGGLVYVALRGSGELATLSMANGQVMEKRQACAQPRGVAYDAKMDEVIVACASGELVTFPAATGAAVQTAAVEGDLRDVVVDGDAIFVSKFRTAEILRLTRAGVVAQRATLPVDGSGSSAAMAWRMRGTTDHRLVVAYQFDSVRFVPTTPGGYGGGGGGVPGPGPGGAGGGPGSAIVRTEVASLSSVDMSTTDQPLTFGQIVLPVDLALLPSRGTAGGSGLVVGAANWKSTVTVPYAAFNSNGGNGGVTMSMATANRAGVDGQLIAAEVLGDGTMLIQSREPARLYVVQPGVDQSGSAANGGPVDRVIATITLSDVSREDTGHTIFHTNSGGSVACASCHGEGGDDAQTWNFDGKKPRRTPSLLGTVKGTAPYHWDADFADLQALSHEVYTNRMGGRSLAHDQNAALQNWSERLPAPKRPAVDPAARARGEALFGGKADCAGCHSGPSYTNNATVDVGTGGAFQVPPLVGVGARTPLFHAGCAKTLTDRFTQCATEMHGKTAQLTTSEISDLVAFLDSL
jgi:cytochrome c